jgi:hypothetical protein
MVFLSKNFHPHLDTASRPAALLFSLEGIGRLARPDWSTFTVATIAYEFKLGL